MAGEAGSLGRAFVEIVVPRAQFESQMAGVGTAFASHTSRMISQGQAAAGAIAAANTGIVSSYNMVTGSIMGLLSAQQLLVLSSNKLAYAMHQGAVAANLMAVGAVDLSVGIAAAGGATKATALSMGSMVGMLKAALPYMAAFAAVAKTVGMAKGATEAQREFNKELFQLWTLTDLTREGIEDLGKEIRDLVYDYNVFAAHGTKAMYQIYSATFFAADATEIFKSGMRAAAAGVTDITTAVDMMTTVLNAYNMSASESEHVNDLLFTAVRYGKTTYSELAGQFGRLAGVAAPAGARLEEMTAAIATLTRQGIMTDWAVTSLRQTIMQMFRPTGHLADLIRSLGYDTGRSMIQANGFAGALKLVSEGAAESGIPLENLFTNVRAITAVLPLVTTAAAGFALDIERTAGAAGTMGIAFEKVAQSWEYRITALKSQINDVAITVGQTLLPAVESFLAVWRELSEGFEAMVALLGSIGEDFAEVAGGMAGATIAAGLLGAAIWGVHKAFLALCAHPIIASLAALAVTIGLIVETLVATRQETEKNIDAFKTYSDALKGLRPKEEIDFEFPLLPILPLAPLAGESKTAFEDVVVAPMEVMIQGRIAQILTGIVSEMIAAVKEAVAAPLFDVADMAELEQAGVNIAELEKDMFELAESTAVLRVLQRELAEESDAVARAIAEGFGYTLMQVRGFREEAVRPREEYFEERPIPPRMTDWIEEMMAKVAEAAAQIDPTEVEQTMEAMADLQDYYGEVGEVLDLFTRKGWKGKEMLEALLEGIEKLLSPAEVSGFVAETYDLIEAFNLAGDGSAEQAAILDELAGRYRTATGWMEQFADTEGEASAELLELIAALEGLGLSVKKLTFVEETYDLIDAFHEASKGSAEQALLLIELAGRYQTANGLLDVFTDKEIAASAELLELIAALEALGLSLKKLTFVEETYELITAFEKAATGSAEQGAALTKLVGRYRTATGYTELFTNAGIIADEELLKLIATLEALGLAIKDLTFAEETYKLIAAFEAAESGSIAQIEALSKLAGRYSTVTGWMELLEQAGIAAGKEVLELVAALEALGLAVKELSFAEETYELIAAFNAAEAGSIAQVEALGKLASRYSTVTGWMELLEKVGISAGKEIMELVAALEALGLAVKELTFAEETYELIAAFHAAAEGSAEQAEALSELAGRYSTVTSWIDLLAKSGIKANQEMLGLVAALEALGLAPLTFIEETKDLIEAYGDLTVGSYEQGEALQGLITYYKTAVTVVELLASRGIKASDALLDLVATLEELGFAPLGFVDETHNLIRSFGELEVGSYEQGEAFQKLLGRYDSATTIVELLESRGITASDALLELVATLEALGFAPLTFIEESYRLIELFDEIAEGSYEQAEAFQELVSRYITTGGVVELLADRGIAASDALLDLVDALKKFADVNIDLLEVTNQLATGIGGLIGKFGGEGMASAGKTLTAGGAAVGALSAATAFAAGPAAWITFGISAFNAILTGWDEFVTKPAAARAEEEAERIRIAFEKVTEGASALAESFWRLVESAESVAAIQEGLAQVQIDIISTLLGFLWPFANILSLITQLFVIQEEAITKEVEARQKLLSNLNVPVGWPINRIRFAAGTPGEAVEFDWGDVTPGEGEAEVSELLTWWQEALEPFRNEILGAIQPIAEFRDAVQAAYEAVFPAIIEGLLPVLDTFGWVLGQISDWITDVFIKDLKNFFKGFGDWWRIDVDPFLRSDVFSFLGEQFNEMYMSLRDRVLPFLKDTVWEDFKNVIWPKLEEVIGRVSDAFWDLWEIIEEHWPTILAWIELKIEEWVKNIELALGDLGETITRSSIYYEELERVLKEHGKTIDDLDVLLREHGSSVVEFGEALMTSKGDVRAAMEEVGLSFRDMLNISDSLGMGLSDLVDAVKEAERRADQEIAGGYTGDGNGGTSPSLECVLNAVQAAALIAAHGFGGVMCSTGQWVPYTSIGGVPVSQLGVGGIAMGPTLSMIGEQQPEVVLPLDRLAALLSTQPAVSAAGLGGINPFSPSAQLAVAGGGGTTININLSQQRLTSIMLKEMTSKNVNDAGVGFAPLRM